MKRRSLPTKWRISPGVTYLNHGSFGPSPSRVIKAWRRIQRRVERQPMNFFLRRLGPELAAARGAVASFLGGDAEDFVFVDNATTAMNIVAASVPLEPGDEVLANNHEYGAVLRLWREVCQRAGATLIVQDLPLPVQSAEDVVGALLSQMSDRTRLLVFSHITSPTAVVLPAAELCAAARQRSVRVCIDGPHAVAMLPLNLRKLDCDYYTASCHKWLSAPFGSGFLYAHPRQQDTVRPAVMSWGTPLDGDAPSWRDEFQWCGTRDPSPWLAVPAAIDFLRRFGLRKFRKQTHELAQYARQQISQLTGLDPLTPDSPDWYGSMTALPLPPGEAAPLQQELWEKHRIEIPVIEFNGQRLLRVSCHLYNSRDDVDHFVKALGELL